MKIEVSMFLVLVLFCLPLASADSYRYCGKDARGDGTTWENQWSCYDGTVPGKMASLAESEPAYLFIDGGNSGITYTQTFGESGTYGGWINAQGGSNTNRIYIMPGYAAEQMGVPGNHGAHTGVATFTAQGGSQPLFRFYGGAHITIDGYSDPRPMAGGSARLVLADRDLSGGLIQIDQQNSDITIRNVELHKKGSGSYHGDLIHINGGGSEMDGFLIEYCYFHDSGFPIPEYAAIWTDYVGDFRARYNEFRNIARNYGEGIGDYTSHESFGGYMDIYGNLFIDVGTAVRGYLTVRQNTFVDTRYAWSHSSTNTAYENKQKHFENNLLVNVDNDFDDGVGIGAKTVRNNVITGDTGVFVDYGKDYRLSSSAYKCIDKGVSWTGDPGRDFLGKSVNGPRDIGAFEYRKSLDTCTDADWSYKDGPCRPDGTLVRTWTRKGSCSGGVSNPASEAVDCDYQQECNLGDIDCDGDVDIFDLVIVAKNFGLSCPGECSNVRADQNGDTEVDIFDLVIVARNFGR